MHYKKKLNKKNIWIERAFSILVEEGSSGISANRIAYDLGITRGAFYHHFKDVEDFHNEVLKSWYYRGSHLLIEKLNNSYSDKGLVALREFAWSLPHELDIAMRSWALHYGLASDYQSKMDADRIEYIYKIYRDYALPEKSDELVMMYSKLAYFSFIGMQSLMPTLKTEELFCFRDFLSELIDKNLEIIIKEVD
ncbi:TetR/AcrR family transcriptional regulator [Alteromonas macleodii]|uniref:HTH tetR-type domain-containing protein n=1 Tax=Alteromonas macleodii TaxID=28108 RepID=A0A6T9Y9V9_ALTMA|nr:TetR/AcrR family transcriptional regulator [Alteromonas macleodii]CAB9495191.1 conserved protein of unknown function [Alteromonas macleodii]